MAWCFGHSRNTKSIVSIKMFAHRNRRTTKTKAEREMMGRRRRGKRTAKSIPSIPVCAAIALSFERRPPFARRFTSVVKFGFCLRCVCLLLQRVVFPQRVRLIKAWNAKQQTNLSSGIWIARALTIFARKNVLIGRDIQAENCHRWRECAQRKLRKYFVCVLRALNATSRCRLSIYRHSAVVLREWEKKKSEKTLNGSACLRSWNEFVHFFCGLGYRVFGPWLLHFVYLLGFFCCHHCVAQKKVRIYKKRIRSDTHTHTAATEPHKMKM